MADEIDDSSGESGPQKLIPPADASALGEELERQRDAIMGYLAKITGEHLRTKVELEDLFQEVCTQALASFESAPLDRMPVHVWLRELAHRKVVDAHRHFFDAKKRASNREVSMDAPRGAGGEDGGKLADMIVLSMTTPSAAMSRNVREHRLWEAINELPDEQKEAIRLRYVEGLPSKEIADKLGKTDTAVRVLLSRAMRKLEGNLDDVRPQR